VIVDLKFWESGMMSNYHYFRVSIDSEYYLQFENNYFLKPYCLRLRGEGGFDKKNEAHLALNDQLKTMNYEHLTVSHEDWGIINLNNTHHITNMGSNTRNILFNLLIASDDEFNRTFGEKFNQTFGDGIIKIVKAVLAVRPGCPSYSPIPPCDPTPIQPQG
jgi:hypothetical protein